MAEGEAAEAVDPYANMEWMNDDGSNSTHTFSGTRTPKPKLNGEQEEYLLGLAGEKAKKPLKRDVTLLTGLIWEARPPTPSYMMPTGQKGSAHVFIGLVSCHSFIYFDRLTERFAERGP